MDMVSGSALAIYITKAYMYGIFALRRLVGKPWVTSGLLADVAPHPPRTAANRTSRT
jgi:hypothetical protein